MRVTHRKEHARNSVGFGRRTLRVSQLTASHTTPRCPVVVAAFTARPSDISQARGIDAAPSRAIAIALRSEKFFSVYPSTVFHFSPRARGGTMSGIYLLSTVTIRGTIIFRAGYRCAETRSFRYPYGAGPGGPRSGVPAALDPGAETCGPLSREREVI